MSDYKYHSMATDDPMGTVKSILSTSLGLIPEIGPFLSLGLNLFFPKSKDEQYSILYKKIMDEMKYKISEAIDDLENDILQAKLKSPKNNWKTYLETDFKSDYNIDIEDINISFQKLAETYHDEKSKSGNALTHLYTEMLDIHNVCELSDEDFKILKTDGKKYISSLINFGSFHLSLVGTSIKCINYMSQHNNNLYKEITDNPSIHVVTEDHLNLLKIRYSNLLREAIEQMSKEVKNTVKTGSYEHLDGLIYDTVEYTPINGYTTQEVGADSINSLGITHKHVYNNYLQVIECRFYSFISNIVLPVLSAWEQNTYPLEDNKYIEFNSNMSPNIPKYPRPAKYIKNFKPYMYKLSDQHSAPISSNLDDGNRTNIPYNDEWCSPNIVANIADFEKTSWLQWGDGNQDDIEFDVYVDIKYHLGSSGKDQKIFKSLKPSSITAPFYNNIYFNGSEFDSDYADARGFYLSKDQNNKEISYMNVYSLKPKSNLNDQEMDFKMVFEVPLTKDQSPQADNNNLPETSNINVKSRWGNKIKDKGVSQVVVYCPSQEWFFGIYDSDKVMTPFDERYASRSGKDFPFPDAMTYSVVLYQIHEDDTQNKFIRYFPVLADTSEYAQKIEIDPNLDLYAAINDNNCNDNKGEVKIYFN